MADPRRPDVINVYAGEWPEDPYPPTEGWLAKWRGLIPQGHDLGLSLYELQPQQTQSPYHFHHASEELMLVLRGRPTLRTADGPALYVIGSSNSSPDICEYPDSGKLLAMSRGESQRGERLWTVHRLEDGVDYLDGEEPRA